MIQTHVIGSYFLSALLPPRDPNEKTFYQILGVSADATDEELRKAYRKLSLKLHPDKIAQRGGDASAKEEAAAKYEKIQEAYHILIDAKKRLKYDAFETPSRYFFVERGQFTNPQSVYENLTSASAKDKCRLVWLFFFAILLVLMQPILVAIKINQSLVGTGALADSSWFLILMPCWIFFALFLAAKLLALAFVDARDRLVICLSCLEYFCWYLGVIFLCLKWEGIWKKSFPFYIAFSPIYIAMILRWSRSLFLLIKVRMDVNRMVTMDFIETEFLKGRSMEELSGEEQSDLKKAFLVVSVDPEFEPHSPGLTAEELEEEKVECSPEYEAATEIYNSTFVDLAFSLVFGTSFLILLILKLDNLLDDAANWWAVFSPIWIERGCRLLLAFKNVFCGGMSGEEVTLYTESDFPANGNISSDIEDQNGSDAQAEKETKPNQIEAEKADEYEVIDTVDAESGKIDEKEKMFRDEDAYRAFENVYEQIEEDGREKRSQSCFSGCVIIFQLLLLCLVVAKIQPNYPKEDTTDFGFNVFWMLFPFFLFFGLALCCCAFLIFGAEPDVGEFATEYSEKQPGNSYPTEETPHCDVIPDTAPQEVSAAVESSTSPAKNNEAEDVDPTSDGTMDDLD